MRVGTRSWYSFNKFPMGLIFSENFSLTPANSFNKFLKRPEFSFFCFAQPLFLADISVTVTLRQKLKKADPNYFSILGVGGSSPKCAFFGEFWAKCI